MVAAFSLMWCRENSFLRQPLRAVSPHIGVVPTQISREGLWDLWGDEGKTQRSLQAHH